MLMGKRLSTSLGDWYYLDDLQLHLGDWYFLDGLGRERGPSSFLDLQSSVDQCIIKKYSRKCDKL